MNSFVPKFKVLKHNLVCWFIPKFKIFKHNCVLRQREALLFLVSVYFVYLCGFTLWAICLGIYGVIRFSSTNKTQVKPLTLREIPYAYYKAHVLNRKYLRIKYFWKHTFLKSYKKLPVSQQVWQIPLLLIISFYNAITTRYLFITTIFYARCGIFFFVFGNIWGLYLMFIYFLPLALITFLCNISVIANALNKTYGKHTMKKLGFNMVSQFFTVHGKRVAGTLVTGAVTVGGYERANTRLCDLDADEREQADINSYKKTCAARDQAANEGRTNLGPEPQFPSQETFAQRRNQTHINRKLPDIFGFASIFGLKPK